MSYVECSLSNGEKIESIFKLHWVSKVPLIIYALIAFPLAPVTFGLSLFPAVYAFFWLRNLEQALTNQRVINKSGVISRRTNELLLRAIENVEIKQGIFGRIFNFGTILVTGRGSSKVAFNNIVNPVAAKKQIESLSIV